MDRATFDDLWNQISATLPDGYDRMDENKDFSWMIFSKMDFSSPEQAYEELKDWMLSQSDDTFYNN